MLSLRNMTPQGGTLHVPKVIKRRRQTCHQHTCVPGTGKKGR